MAVTARLNNLRIAPRKVRLVANLLKGMSVDDAMAELHFLSKATARPLEKLLKTAAADAEHNFQLAKTDLFIKSVIVNAAPTFKRYMPRAFGRAGMIRKRGSNVIVTLESKTGAKVAKPVKAEKPTVTEADHAGHDHEKEPKVKKSTKSTGGAKKSSGNARRLFQRKTG
jgi:large subunit ribosomal protein L22